ncbi:gamma carbonic anhydrase family protein [Nocardia cerradoensis]|uniref:Carnitine operon protein CaiE n=1 Tax=Nocardia cerradoensis TaxID=85688 RepID=A0A231GTR5_9NOCA|nr:gamma carbonic anhydrase family protein [Nocardia cerradoensis]NKY41873.1 gamma carbonic anhydrase family protein [Nocardia cerradoensis]OXR39982.1 Carnitine operon protein CaiE [Nocardia cerradoensis]
MPIYSFGGHHPDIHPTAFVHPDAVVIGAVSIGEHASIWPTAVLRADFGRIEVGARTSIQDGTVLHTSERWPTVVGADCVVGHNAHLEGATIEPGTLVGSMSTCLQGVVVGRSCIVGAGALLTEGTHVPEGNRALGVPASTFRPHPDRAAFDANHRLGVAKYVVNAARYVAELGCPPADRDDSSCASSPA